MFTKELRKVLAGGKKNKEFLKDIWAADRDKQPSLIAGQLEKALFINVYYGWLVGKYGMN